MLKEDKWLAVIALLDNWIAPAVFPQFTVLIFIHEAHHHENLFAQHFIQVVVVLVWQYERFTIC